MACRVTRTLISHLNKATKAADAAVAEAPERYEAGHAAGYEQGYAVGLRDGKGADRAPLSRQI